MLKNLPIELLEGRFDGFCNMELGVVVEQDDLALFIGSFLLDSFIHTVQLGYVEVLLNFFVVFEHFPMNKSLTVPPNANHSLFGVEVALNSRLWRAFWSHPLFPLLHIHVETPFLISRNNPVQKSSLVVTCCSMSGKMLSSNFKTFIFVVFSEHVWHPSSKFLSKTK